MEPFITLVVVTGAWLLAPRLRGREAPAPWPVALRAGVSAMFVLTGVAHFVGLRDQLVAMVPDVLPAPELLVTVTGVLELAGAAALWAAPLRRAAAAGLGLLLVAMFPANVHHALNSADLGVGEALLPRTLLQVVFLAAVVGILVAERRVAHGPDEPVQRQAVRALSSPSARR